MAEGPFTLPLFTLTNMWLMIMWKELTCVYWLLTVGQLLCSKDML